MKHNQISHRLGQITFLLFLMTSLMAMMTFNPLAPSAPILATATSQAEATTEMTTSPPTASPTSTPSPSPSFIPTASLTSTPLPSTATATHTASPTRTPTLTPSPTATSRQTPTPTPTIPSSKRLLVVDQDRQMMFVYENEVRVRSIPVSTGTPVTNQFTPAWTGQVGADWGSGSIGRHGFYADFMWYLFDGPEGSILIHSVPYQRKSREKAYDRLDALGVRPTSNGCVRISPPDAAWLKAWDPVDVPIRITRWSGGIDPAENLLLPGQGGASH